MTTLREHLLNDGPLERVVGRVRSSEPGPTLMVVAGIHGNEPASVLAARRVFAQLQAENLPLRGDFAVLAGNLGALRQGERGITRDLNRGWTRRNLESLPRGVPGLAAVTRRSPSPEDREQRDLFEAIELLRRDARGPVTFMDLHTTSAPGIPFAMVRNAPEQRAFAEQFALPLIMGLLELVDHTLLEFMRSEGCLTFGVEAGQNDAESSIDHHESVLWQALVSAGIAFAADVDLAFHRRRLLDACGHLPHVTEVEHRHSIAPEDGFRMEPGFGNIQRVQAGQLLARDHSGEIRAPRNCVLLMPLYQSQGDDGFFLGREMGPRISA